MPERKYLYSMIGNPTNPINIGYIKYISWYKIFDKIKNN